MSSLKKLRRDKARVRLSRSVGGTAAIFFFLLIVGTFMALPIIYSLIQSVKPLEEIFAYPPKFFVKNPTFDNYIQVYQLCQNLWVPLSRYIFNSVFVSVVGTVVYVFIASAAAFPLSKHKFPGKGYICSCGLGTSVSRRGYGCCSVYYHIGTFNDKYILVAFIAAACEHFRRFFDDAVYGKRNS